jgi:hypothetical protein
MTTIKISQKKATYINNYDIIKQNLYMGLYLKQER